MADAAKNIEAATVTPINPQVAQQQQANPQPPQPPQVVQPMYIAMSEEQIDARFEAKWGEKEKYAKLEEQLRLAETEEKFKFAQLEEQVKNNSVKRHILKRLVDAGVTAVVAAAILGLRWLFTPAPV